MTETHLQKNEPQRQILHKKKKQKLALKSPKQERSRITVNAVIAACSKILVEEGFFGVTTEKIAQEAGVSIGSLYQFFGNKESVVSAVIQDLFEKDKAYFLLHTKQLQNFSCEEKIHKMIQIGFDIYRTEPQLRSKIQSLHLYLTDSRFYLESLQFYQDYITKMIPETLNERSRSKIAGILLHAFIGMMNTATKETLHLADKDTREEIFLFFSSYFEVSRPKARRSDLR